MRRHLAEPFDAAVLHRRVGVEALGDGVGDDGLPLLLEQRDEPLLLGHQRVDLRRLPVEEGGDGDLLFSGGGKGDECPSDLLESIADSCRRRARASSSANA